MRAASQAALKDSELEPAEIKPTAVLAGAKTPVFLFLLTTSSILVHGYHPFVEDAEIYVPGIKKLLNSGLYPFNDGFFASHAKMTLFPNLMAWSVRTTRLPLEWVLLAWHFVCIFSLLLACWRLGQICFGTALAAWGSAVMVASLETIPVSGTALYVMDQYLNARSFSAAAVVWIVVSVAQRKYRQAAGWLLFTALLHPLLAGFSLVFAALLIWQRTGVAFSLRNTPRYAVFPMALFPPVTSAYRLALDLHSYFFLLRWEWYEWLGVFGPLLMLWWFRRIARSQSLVVLETLTSAAIVFGVLFLVLGLMITIPPQFTRFVELQPMRSLQIVYILLLAISGGLLAERVLKTSLWRWLALFLPLCAGMFYVQRQLFPATAHLELPGRVTNNAWVQAFLWIRDNTPVDAYFVLDPDHMRLEGEDQHGFRAIAERSMLADRVKDSGAVTMFPALAPDWLEQVNSEAGWKRFGVADVKRLQQKYGVNWVVFEQPGIAGIECPYRNSELLVCRTGDERAKALAQ